MSKKRYVCEALLDGESQIFKRYGTSAEAVKEELSVFLLDSYGFNFQILAVDPDKTKTVKNQ